MSSNLITWTLVALAIVLVALGIVLSSWLDERASYWSPTDTGATPAGGGASHPGPTDNKETAMTEQPQFTYWSCPECEFDVVERAGAHNPAYCPMCRVDNGHKTAMMPRIARDTDQPEGHDERKEARS